MKTVGLLFAVAHLTFAQAPSFTYDRSQPLDIQRVATEQRGGVRVEDITFRNLAGGRTEAYLILPAGQGKTPGALFVHWYESESPLSNRKQFLEEAVELGRHGLISLLVATPWSDPQWYPKRDVKRDYENSVDEVKELRRALDVLMAQPRVDAQRVAYVGHDFGAMHGTVMAAVDKRPKVIALQAFAGSFSDWFLYNQRQLTAEGKQAVIDRLAPLDPLKFIAQLGHTPALLQFANEDFYVPRPKAEALYAAVPGPKKILWYDGGHGLNPQASVDRQTWLRKALRLR
jgi:cephalosporin-C deacetylase-like acetyl esterase